MINFPNARNSQLFTSDFAVAKAYPAYQYGGLETSAIFYETREVNGSLYTVQNATWNPFANEWMPVNTALPVYGTVMNASGVVDYIYAPAGETPIPAFTLTPVFGPGGATPIGVFNPMNYGAVGNGTTDDTAAVVAANAAAYAVGGALTITNPHLISGVVTLNAPRGVVFEGTGKFLGTPTLAINAPISALPVQILPAITTMTIAAGTPVLYAEWFGAKGDGVTDDALAINIAITVSPNQAIVQLLARTYSHASTIVINRFYFTLQGAGRRMTYLSQTANTFDSLYIHGSPPTGFVPNNINSVFVQDLSLQVNTNTAVSGIGINVQYADLVQLRDIRVVNHCVGLYANNTNNLEGHSLYIDIENGTATSNNVYGIQLNGAWANNSCNFTECVVNLGGYTGSGVTYGYYLYSSSPGGRLNDCFFNMCEAGSARYGWYIDGTNALVNGVVNPQTGSANTLGPIGALDVHLTRCIADSIATSAYYVQNWPPGGTLSINGGWAACNGAGAYNVYVNGSTGVTVRALQIFGVLGVTGLTGVYLLNSNGCAVTENEINNQVAGILISGSSASSVDKNVLYNAASVAGGTAIHATATSTRNSVSHNVVNGSGAGAWTTGVLLDAASDYCNVIGNIVNSGAVTTTVSNNAANTHSYVAGVVV